jgi:hypothetical protein
MEYRSFVYDIEIYPNLFLAIFKSLDGAVVHEFERSDWCDDLAELDAFLDQEALELIGFNNHFYDDIVLKEILYLRSRGEAVTNARLKQLNDALILHRKQLVKGHHLEVLRRVPLFASVDLSWLGSGLNTWRHWSEPERQHVLTVSLKTLQARIGWHNLQELPFPPEQVLGATERQAVIAYCHNDIDATRAVLGHPRYRLLSAMKLRAFINATYPFLITKERPLGAFQILEAAIAEQIVRRSYEEAAGTRCVQHAGGFVKPRTFLPPSTWIRLEDVVPPGLVYRSPENNAALEAIRGLAFDPEDPATVTALKAALTGHPMQIQGQPIVLQLGGLHTNAHSRARFVKRPEGLLYVDVSSYYPSLILSFDRPPMGLDRVWIAQYRELVATRLRFKQRAADKQLPEAERSQAALFAESLKIIINAVYGKLGLKSSIVYDPLMANQVTLRGQLYLIDLIEALVAAGGELLMGNTDGLLLDPAGHWEALTACYADWAARHGMVFEAERWTVWLAKDVNNYYALDSVGDVHTKGQVFNSNAGVVPAILGKAAAAYLLDGVPLQATVRAARVEELLINTPAVARGCEVLFDGEAIQRVNRYYWSYAGGTIFKVCGAKRQQIAHDALLANRLPEAVPTDLSVELYVAAAQALVDKLLGTANPKKKGRRPAVDTSVLVFDEEAAR